jgi:hypothetical protein
MNKHLCKIVYEYINTKNPYINELLNKTTDVLEDTNYWYTYNTYAKCNEDYLDNDWVRNNIFDGKFTYVKNWNYKWLVVDSFE